MLKVLKEVLRVLKEPQVLKELQDFKVHKEPIQVLKEL